jgi:hypothetical protein
MALIQATSQSVLSEVKSQRSKKKVRFTLLPELNFVLATIDNDGMSSDDHIEWWDSSDIALFKAHVAHMAEQARKNEALSKRIERIYEKARVASSKDEQTIQRTLETISLDTCLTLWGSIEPLRGVEKYFLTRKYGRKGGHRSGWKGRCREYRTTVITNQDKLSDEDLRNKCLSLSGQDRVFARMIGEADAHELFLDTPNRIITRRPLPQKSLSRRCRITI